MKVWIVMCESYEDKNVEGVFSAYEKAKEFLNARGFVADGEGASEFDSKGWFFYEKQKDRYSARSIQPIELDAGD